MSLDLSNLELRVNAQPGIRELQAYDAAAGKADRSSRLLDQATERLAKTFGLYKAIQVARDTIALADAYTLVNARLALVSRGSEDLVRTQTALFEAAQASRQEFTSVAELYTRLARVGRELGASQQQLLAFTEGTSLALKVSGTSSEQASGALIQLSQALGAGIVRAEEFNSILEGAPRIAQAVADGFGETGIKVSELRNRVIQGQVSSQAFFEAFLKGSQSIKAEAASLPSTVGGAFTQLRNAVLKYVGEANSSSGTTATLAAAIEGLARNLDEAVDAATAVAVVFGARFLSGGVDSLSQMAKATAVARAETVAYATDATRTAQAQSVAAAERLAALEAERVAIRANLVAQREYLATASARIARAVPEAALAPLGGAVAQRDSAAVLLAYKQQADAQNVLNAATERSVALNGEIVAARGAQTAATAAAVVAEKELAVATSLTIAIQQKAIATAEALYAAIGGPVGAVVLAVYAVYKAIYDTSNGLDKQREAAERGATAWTEYKAALDRLSTAQLRQQLADAERVLTELQAKISTLSFNAIGGGNADFLATFRAIREEQAKIGEIKGKLAPVDKAAEDASKKALDAATERVRVAQQALALADLEGAAAERQEVIDRAINDTAKARAEFQGKDLAITLESIEAEKRLGLLAVDRKITLSEQLKLMQGLADQMALARKNDAEIQANFDGAKKSFSERLDALQKQNDALAAQAVALSLGRKEFDAVVAAQQIAAALEEAKQAAAKAGLQLTNEQLDALRQQLQIQQQLQGIVSKGSGTAPKPPVAETQAWAQALQTVVQATQGIAGAFGDVGSEIGAAVSQAGALLNAIVRIQAAESAQRSAKSAAEVSAAGAASSSAAVAAATAVIGLASALNKALDPTEKLRQKAEELTAAYNRQFEAARKLVDVRTDSSAAISATSAQLTRAAEQALGAALKAATANGKPNGDAINAAFRAFEEALGNIADFATERAKAIAEQAKKLQAFTLDNDVLALRIQGRTDEADAMQVQIDIERKYQEAVALYGETAETARYHTLLLAQATDAAAQAAIEKAAIERRSIFDLQNNALAFTDPRAAGDAAFAEAQQRRYNDAVKRGASEAELAAIAMYNLAESMDRARKIAEQDLRTQEGLIGRILGTLGNDRATQDQSLAATQRQEIADAIAAGMSPSNLALLRFTQFAERSQLQMQRAIEDGTKAILKAAKEQTDAIDEQITLAKTLAQAQIDAIDAQIKETQAMAKQQAAAYDAQITAIREQTKAQLDAIDAQVEAARGALEAANAQVAALDKQVQTNLKVVEALQTFSNSIKLGDLSPLSPQDKLAESRRQFEELVAASRGGDAEAAGKIPAAAQAFLAASRGFNASSPAFANDFNRVQSIVAELTAKFGATLPVDQQALEAARQAVIGIQGTIDALGKQKDVIQRAAESQISVLQAAKEQAATDAQRIIDKLEERKTKISADTDALITKLESDKKAIMDQAQIQIDTLVRVETEAHLFRLRQDEYWQTFLGLTGDSPTGNGPETLPGDGTTTPTDRTTPILQSQLDAQQETTRVLKEKLDALTTKIDTLTTVEVAASTDDVLATGGVRYEVNELRKDFQMLSGAIQTLAGRLR